MPKKVNIEIFRIAQTEVNVDPTSKWLEFLGAKDFEVPSEEAVSDPALLISLAAKRCYKSFQVGLNPNVTKVRNDYVEYFDNILASGHGSVLEHATFSYAIENLSRVATAELNRHRAGWAISEQSLRFVRFDEIPYWEPPSIQPREDDSPDITARKARTRELFWEAFSDQEKHYKELMELWNIDEGAFAYKKEVTSLFRRIVGLGVATGGVWTGNVRALRHVMAMRCAPAAEEEIRYIFTNIAEDLVKSQPLLFGDFHIATLMDPSGNKPNQEYYAPKYPKV